MKRPVVKRTPEQAAAYAAKVEKLQAAKAAMEAASKAHTEACVEHGISGCTGFHTDEAKALPTYAAWLDAKASVDALLK